MKPIAICTLLFLVIFQDAAKTPPKIGECTIGVFSGLATTDGRPILWKNRDIREAVQKFCYYAPTISITDTTLAFIADANSSDTTRVYMGLNSAGFAIINGNSYNLGDDRVDGIDDGALMRRALDKCRSLEDFEHLLDASSIIGRKDSWNYGAIDAFGNAALYECSNFSYVKYDAVDSIGEGNGLVLRATFSFSGGANHDGLPRYKRATDLVRERMRTERIDPQFILQTLSRDLANPIANPYPLPYSGTQNNRPAGFICVHDITINRDNTRSVAIIRGVAPGEDPRLATLYGMIGQPVVSIVYPLWVESHTVPYMLNWGTEVPMYTQVVRRLAKLYSLHNDGEYIDSRYLVGKDSSGMFAYTLPLEASILRSVENYLTIWRAHLPDSTELAEVQDLLADSIYISYLRIPLDFSTRLVDSNEHEPQLSNYPNPFNANTTINLSGFMADEPVALKIYDLMGREVREFHSHGGLGNHVVWDGRDGSAKTLSSGVYIISAASSSHSLTTKALLIK